MVVHLFYYNSVKIVNKIIIIIKRKAGVCRAGRMLWSEGRAERFAGSVSKCLQWPGLDQAKLRNLELHRGSRVQVLGPFSPALPGMLEGSCIRNRAPSA